MKTLEENNFHNICVEGNELQIAALISNNAYLFSMEVVSEAREYLSGRGQWELWQDRGCGIKYLVCCDEYEYVVQKMDEMYRYQFKNGNGDPFTYYIKKAE